MADNQKKSTKTFAVITYAIMFLCILAGLALPPSFDFANNYNSVIWQIPHALKCVGVDWPVWSELVNPYPVYFWGGEAFELGGLFLLLFALVGVVALISLFIVIFGNKGKDTSLKCSKFIAVISTIVLSVLLCMQMAKISALSYEFGGSWNIPLLIAFGGSIVILFVQSIYDNGGSGVVKTLLTLLSMLAIVLCVFSFAAILPQLADALKDVLKGNTQILGWTVEGNPYLGSIWFHLSLPFSVNYGEILKELGGLEATLSVLMLILGVLIIVNFFLDVLGHAKNTKRWMLFANLIRYGVELLLALAILIIGKFSAGKEIGIICFALIAIAALPVIINIIRLLAYKGKKAKEQEWEDSEYATTDSHAHEPAPAQHQPKQQPAPQQAQPAAHPAPVAQSAQTAQPAPKQPEPVQPAQPAQPAKQATAAPVASQTENVYAPVIYSGPRDKFIDTLANEEKIEFSRVFLEHRSGNIQGVPEYVLDGDNDNFFRSLFIYYARVRGLVSDGLMNKFYEKVSAINK